MDEMKKMEEKKKKCRLEQADKAGRAYCDAVEDARNRRAPRAKFTDAAMAPAVKVDRSKSRW